MERWERDFVHDIVSSYLDPIVPRGYGDLAAEVAFHYPITGDCLCSGAAGYG
jgi:hypothetical protein